jgi:demethoxyubiquinone hydroxylase (CLK1/Coq7/Cat5 family)
MPMILEAFRRLGRPQHLPFDMFEHDYSDTEARRARRMESIYHVGQVKIWDGREVLAELMKKHGRPAMGDRERRALSRIFSTIMWGELGAWKISAQLADRIEPLEAKLAAASQVHDEARHFYVMHDYLDALGDRPPRLDFWAQRVLELTLRTDSLAKKLLGMQLTIETIALTIFQQVREMNVEPVLSELLSYYERDEARHVGLGVQMLPQLMAKMTMPEHAELAMFQLNLLVSTLASLKAMEPDLLSIGVDPRAILVIGFRKHTDLQALIKAEFPRWPDDPVVPRVFEGLCELFFPSEGVGVRVSLPSRFKHAVDVVRRVRPSVRETYAATAAS